MSNIIFWLIISVFLLLPALFILGMIFFIIIESAHYGLTKTTRDKPLISVVDRVHVFIKQHLLSAQQGR
jgi:hypothetical protein